MPRPPPRDTRCMRARCCVAERVSQLAWGARGGAGRVHCGHSSKCCLLIREQIVWINLFFYLQTQDFPRVGALPPEAWFDPPASRRGHPSLGTPPTTRARWRFRSWEAAGLPLPPREGPSAVACTSLYCSSPRSCQVVWLHHLEQQRRAACSWLLPLARLPQPVPAPHDISNAVSLCRKSPYNIEVHPSRGCTRRGDWVAVIVVAVGSSAPSPFLWSRAPAERRSHITCSQDPRDHVFFLNLAAHKNLQKFSEISKL